MNMEFTKESAMIKPGHLITSPLNANPNPKHFSYKVLGIFSWSVLIFCLVGLMAARRLLLDVARVVAIYMMIRLIALTFFYMVGLVKIRKAEKQAKSRQTNLETEIAPDLEVHHLVVIPNYMEPPEILHRTLQSLAVQQDARDRMTVVLGMEEREQDARDKARALIEQFKGRFFCMLATYHPSHLPGENPGKATNESWATYSAHQELVDRLGITTDKIVVTVVDSDSIVHPYYFGELRFQFTADPRRYSLIWQAPILLDNDIWQTNAAIRLVTFFSNAISAGDYFNPWEARFPYSTYSISMRLLEDVNYWDPTLVAEDVNIFMRSFFQKGGKAFIQRIFLPVHGNPVHGANLWHAMSIFYNQKVRQGWGGTEIGNLFQKWDYATRAPFLYKFGRLLKLIHDHLFFSTAGFIVSLGTVLSILLDHSAVITIPPVSFSPLFFILLNLVGGSTLVVIWITERLRLSRGRMDWNLKTLLPEVVSWAIFPVLFFLLINLPGLQAQTRMLLGQSLPFKRTPKGSAPKFDD